MNELTFKVQGMVNAHCREVLEKALRAVPGVKEASIDLPTGIAVVKGDAVPTAVMEAASRLGYQISLC